MFFISLPFFNYLPSIGLSSAFYSRNSISSSLLQAQQFIPITTLNINLIFIILFTPNFIYLIQLDSNYNLVLLISSPHQIKQNYSILIPHPYQFKNFAFT